MTYGIQHIDVGPQYTHAEFVTALSHDLRSGNAFPAGAVERDLFYRNDLSKWYIYDGANWIDLTVGSWVNQDVRTTASPTWVGATFTGLTASRLLATDAAKALSSVAALSAWVAGTANRVTVSDDGDGSITLNLPQNIHTAASPQFARLYLDDASTYLDRDGALNMTFTDAVTGTVTLAALATGWAPVGASYVTITAEAGLTNETLISALGVNNVGGTNWSIVGASGNVSFAQIISTTLTASRPLASGAAKELVSTTFATWIAGTANQIVVTDDLDGTITLSLPQDIDTSADVTFDSLVLDDLTASRMVASDGGEKLVSIADLTAWIAGTANQIVVTDDLDGTLTLSLPQDIDTSADVTFDSLVLDDLTASRMVATDGGEKLVSIADLTAWIAGTANEITVTSDGDGTVTLAIPDAVTLVNLTVTDITIGADTLDTNEWAFLNGLDQALKKADNVIFATVTVNNSGIHILDTNASHDLILAMGSDIDADRTLTFTTGNADRTITLSGNPTLADWFDQAVKQASSPQFARLYIDDANTYIDKEVGNEMTFTDIVNGTLKLSDLSGGGVGAAPKDATYVTITGNAILTAEVLLSALGVNDVGGTHWSITGATGALAVTSIDTGEGATEVFAMNQDVESTDDVIFATVTVNNSGIHILDTGGDHDLILASGENLGADRILTLTLGDAARTITLSGNPTLSDWFDQAVKQASSPTFAGVTLSGLTASRLLATDGAKALASVGDLTAWVAGTGNQIIITDDLDGTITLSLPQNIDTSADVTFDSLVLDDLTASRPVATDGAEKLVSTTLATWVAGTATKITVTDDGDGSITLTIPDAVTLVNLTVTDITIGANTLSTTEWAFLDGLDQALKKTDSPIFANPTVSTLHIIDATTAFDLIIASDSTPNFGADRQLTIDLANAARSLILQGNLTVESASLLNQDLTTDADVIFGTLTVNNSGIHILDTGGDHDLILAAGSDLSIDRILTFTTGDAARTITLSGNPTLDDWFDQAVKQASSPTFANIQLTDDGTAFDLILDSNSTIPFSADRTLTLDLDNVNRTIKFSGNPTLGDWFDQAVKQASNPTFAGANLTNELKITLPDPDIFLRLVDSDTSDELRFWFNSAGIPYVSVWDNSASTDRLSFRIYPATGQLEPERFALGLQAEVTIDTGVATIIGNNVQLDTEDDDPSDDLDTITWANVRDGAIIILRTVVSTRDVVVKHGTGNLALSGTNDFTLSHVRDKIMLVWDGGQSKWCELSRSTNV